MVGVGECFRFMVRVYHMFLDWCFCWIDCPGYLYGSCRLVVFSAVLLAACCMHYMCGRVAEDGELEVFCLQ
uniref:Ovule protein n=1 Tax=Syphacia muris TaxID=451379 RepID=A0A0N5AGK6_9BILA